ncbi:hypothetical protein SAMN04487857_101525 [Pseudomonas sp. ok272]|uniref:hypothetical protein n=1 Tax=unclassified Pseudomonas TaxID=196821 RepID=UPI0008AD5144|nr:MULTISPECIES: hypothetical protein [unclassified Pseudomonas]SEM39241.1 hypothetical protein SAMN04487857_101525 [Pseudomonas sp. ok272]SFM40139.1 hypothetical protein SAMN04487858_102527 [Pseudomonas sp. ok602]
MNKELENALAFYESAPPDDYSGIEGKWLWFWEVLQGDFHETPSTAQVVTGTVIFMIPLVDQIGDVRDLIANCRKINKDGSDSWAWVALVLTLIGLFPVLGSLVKGCFKVVVFQIRRELFKAAKHMPRIDDAVIDNSIGLLRRHLDHPAVRKTLDAMKIPNAYLYMATKLSELRNNLSVTALLQRLDDLMQVTRQLFDSIIKWVPQSMRERIEQLWTLMLDVRSKADEGLGRALSPAQDCLDRIINRLRVEGDNAYRALPGNNTHVLGQREVAELELIKLKRPEWVDKVKGEKHSALADLPPSALKSIAEGWPDVSSASKNKSLRKAFKTFHKSIEAVEVSPGKRIYRVVDPGSGDNSICWMHEAEFMALRSKSQWRREFAVWKHWNENGEYVIYTVPPGDPLKVWQGTTATQIFKPVPGYKLEGGRQQIVLNPDDLSPKFVSPRQRTGWGYDDGTGDMRLDPFKPYLGLPELTHKWHMPEIKKEP